MNISTGASTHRFASVALAAAIIATVSVVATPAAAITPTVVASSEAEPAVESLLVRIDSSTDPGAVAELDRAPELDGTGEHVGFGFREVPLEQPAVASEAEAIAADLVESGEAVEAVPNLPTRLSDELGSTSTSPAATQTSAPWGLDRIDQRALPINGAYTYGAAGAGVTAYVLDSGVLTTHQEFQGRATMGYSAYADVCSAPDPNGHGTHVAGTIAGEKYGVAKQATIIGVRVFGCDGSGDTAGLIRGLDWVRNHHQAGAPAVANLSLGVEGVSSAVDFAVNQLIADGVTVVVASGNARVDSCSTSPGRVAAAVTVNASTSSDARADFSNFGSCSDIYAPGTAIPSAWPSSTSAAALMSGTSMAAPHVSGAAALLLSSAPTMSPAAVHAALLSSATPIDPYPSSTVDAKRLLYMAGVAAPVPPSSEDLPSGFTALSPARLVDTRPGQSTIDGMQSGVGRVGPGAVLRVQVAGRGGVPATGAGAVVLNVTITGPSDATYLTVFPSGTAAPNASNLNASAGQTIPNSVVAKVGADGYVSIRNNAGWTDVVVDVNGWFPATQAFTALSPARLVDTRPGQSTIDGMQSGVGRVGPGAVLRVQVAGRGGVPATGAGAVVLNVTITGPSDATYLTVFPSGTAAPNASNLNASAGQTIPNSVVAKVGADGYVSIRNNAGWTDVVVDVNGWFPATQAFTALSPARLVDTRPGQSTIDGMQSGVGRVGPGAVLRVQVAGRGGVPATGAGAVVLNVTITGPSDATYLTVFPSGTAAPNASNLNASAGQTIPNSVVAKVGADGYVSIRNNAGWTDVVVDVNGWFPAT